MATTPPLRYHPRFGGRGPAPPFGLPRPLAPRSSSSSSDNSFPILAIAILGIVTTAFLLLCYYVFVIKCCLNWNRFNVLRRFTRTQSRNDPFIVYAPAVENRGLDESMIRAIPIFQYKLAGGVIGIGDDNEKNNSHECAVCLSEFQDNERLRLLPNCTHAFHIDCIDTWLQTNANCPLCRSSISSAAGRFSTDRFMANSPHQYPNQMANNAIDVGQDIVIELSGDGSYPAPRSVDEEIAVQSTATARRSPSPRKLEQRTLLKKQRKLHHVSSMGDECIDVRVKDDRFSVQPIRRSFSMDSSDDRQLYLSVQEILQQNPQLHEVSSGEGSSSNSSRIRRSFFSFGHIRGSRNAVLPIQFES
ncbi:RING-H2 finger protein ATL16-like [Magnolia sinica]|uniref:RING-H2 finger protein ATL16-like n=1 Tax=Magnolia sinica TaxID=86752 RepID=UPI002659CD6D|nr:RING-H2 finger protein ATL16-like [Magnolia sinica]